MVVNRGEQRSHVAVAGIRTALADEWAGRAGLVIMVGQVARSRTVNLARIAAEAEGGRRERHLSLSYQIRAVVFIRDQNLVPIDLQICGDADACDAGWHSSGQVGDDGARQSGG